MRIISRRSHMVVEGGRPLRGLVMPLGCWVACKMVFFTVFRDVFSAPAINVGVEPCLYAPFIIPLLYGVSSGPRRRLPAIGPNGVRGMVLWWLEDEVVELVETRKRAFLDRG